MSVHVEVAMGVRRGMAEHQIGCAGAGAVRSCMRCADEEIGKAVAVDVAGRRDRVAACIGCRLGKPKYATCVSNSDVFDGWRDHRVGAGIVMDVETGEIVCSGLSMPHSPR